MTKLTRSIRRETTVLSPIRSGGGRPIIVILHPHGLIELREKGRRSGYTLPLEKVYQLAAMNHADQLRAAKQARRKKAS